MPRPRSPNRDKAFLIYQEHGGTIENRRIAEMLEISEKTVSGWKCKDKWEEQLNGVLQSDIRSTPKERGGQPGNQNAVGNDGGAPLGNKNAERHGFFSRWLPAETLEIMQQIQANEPIDLLWDQIMIQYTAIIRAQQIMYVRDADDLSKEISMESEEATAWDVQQAWDKQAKFLQAQSRAMTTLNGMIKQYEELLQNDLATEERRERIAKLKAETAKISEDKGDDGAIIFFGGDLLED